jgi:hypothetical protein
VNTVMNLQVACNVRKCFNSYTTGGFSRRASSGAADYVYAALTQPCNTIC